MMKNFQHIAPEKARTQTRFGETPLFKEGLYQLGHNVYAWMVPNGSWGESNAGLIVGPEASILVDTLWDVAHTQEMLTHMRPLTRGRPIKFLFNSHADGDHFMGNELVNSAEQIISTQAAYEEMIASNPKAPVLLTKVGRYMSLLGKLGFTKMAQTGHWFQQMMAPYDLESVQLTYPNRHFHNELRLDVGGRAVFLYEVGPHHTHGDAIAYVPDAKILFAADLLFIGVTPPLWAGPAENWLVALERIMNMDVDVYVPGHGPLVTDIAEIQQLKDYWEFFLEAVQSRHQAGLKPAEAARDIALSRAFRERPFGQWNSPERIMVSVHTQYRHLNGRTDPPKVPELLGIMRQQALLAHEFPQAEPQSMRFKQ